MNTKKAVTAHFMFQWGVPKRIHLHNEPLQKLNELAVMEFQPKDLNGQWRFATNGMSLLTQSSEKTLYRTELYMGSSSSEAWIIKLLAAVARYPAMEETSLHEFDTISVEGPIDELASPFTAVLIAPPGPNELDTLGGIIGITPEPILINQVVGIYESECHFAIRYNGEELWKLLLGLNQTLLIDQNRPNVI